MARKRITTLAYRAIRIEGGLIPADELTRLTTLADPASTEQTEAHYRISKGLKLRDEIGRDFKIALSLWKDFQALRKRSDVNAHEVTVREFLLPLMRDVLHFSDIGRCAAIESSGHSYAIGHAAEGGRVPLVFAAHDRPLDAPAERFGETSPDTGKVRRRSPYMLAQEALNASDASLWAIVTNGLTLRILRDNPSLTRPAYVEVDLEALFTEELYPDFTALWLLAHASRFGSPPGEPTNCVWERWRAVGLEAGVTVRTNLRYQVAEALRALGTGFLSHPANGELRAALQRLDGEDGALSRQAFFEELLRLVYRLIFLSTVEDRIDKSSGHRLIFTPDASPEVQQRYLSGYSMTWLRERAVRRSQHDRHSDLWQALTITFGALAKGEPHLGLPALGGLFDADQCAWFDGAQLENRWLLAAVFQLGWFRADGSLTRVNYRDMGPEELGSVYESLLELVPDLQMLSQPAAARLAFIGDDESEGSTKGNTRKLTGSYYTPDSLVQELIKTALEPIIADTVRASPERPVDALLGLTICDPACGSGHFLLSAARRLADEVAIHRAAGEREGGAPTPMDYRHALRDGGQPLYLWRGQEPDGHSVGQDGAVA
ncbi:N-6 DNA methylase [Cupriavidus basilensis]